VRVLARIRRGPNGRIARLSGLSILLLALWAPTAQGADPADVAATHAYLQARYGLTQALVHDAAAYRAAEAHVAGRIGRECQGVLARAPSDEPGLEISAPTTPRDRGEQQRREDQRQALASETFRVLDHAGYQVDRPAIERFLATVGALHWSDPRIPPVVEHEANELRDELNDEPPPACADMRFWTQSGFGRLSASSKAFREAQEAERRNRPGVSLDELLAPYEGPAERKLRRRTVALERSTVRTFEEIFGIYMRLQHALGVPESEPEKRRRERMHEPVLGRGTTLTGTKVVVRRGASVGIFGRTRCRHPIMLELAEEERGGILGLLSGSFPTLCLGRRQPPLQGTCDETVTTVDGVAPASVRTVELTLSDGRTVEALLFEIPKRFGGPAGVFVQRLRGVKPYVVSITELDASGAVVRRIDRHLPRCRREHRSGGLRFVELAHGTLPNGEPFTIHGVFIRSGAHSAELTVSVDTGRENNEASPLLVGPEPKPKPKPFKLSLSTECLPHQYAIVYGMLAPPGGSVLARTPAGLVPLTKAPIVAHLHPRGPLFYGAFPSVPTELVVLRPDGSTLYTESLAARAKEEAEFCEGYAEPSS